ncbi:ABC transporter permease [Natronolimnohabitans sp. A-GB9]|uniref:ABC transporter permease n=1 Tax=Natronolimnohabitans sp. A-GB9 TaxID=3069757 RepID=UPI0031F32344
MYLVENSDEVLYHFRGHLELVVVAELAALAFAIPASILAVRHDRIKKVVLGLGNVGQTIPTLAILALALPLLGLGFWPSILGLWAYAILPIIVNTVKGIENVDEEMVEAARGMGMTDWEILRSIQLPLALPVIFAGVRTSIVLVIGTAYLAMFIGGPGLGVMVVGGIQAYDWAQVIAGAIPGALLAIGADLSLSRIERYLGGDGGIDDTTVAA